MPRTSARRMREALDGLPRRTNHAPTENMRMPMIEATIAAPEFNLPNQDGIDTSLSALRGKWVVLWWYPKADTPG